MKVIIAGSRSINNSNLVKRIIEESGFQMRTSSIENEGDMFIRSFSVNAPLILHAQASGSS